LGITENNREKVYDISVGDNHSFFANGILVHNCHHIASKTCKEVLMASSNAYWRFGGSATPYRESGDDILLQAMMGVKIVDISASYLIRRGFLIKPYIFFEPIQDHISFHSYPKVYKHAISQNIDFNTHVADTANHLVSKGLSTLVLVQHYPQGDMLKKLIPNTEFVTGKMTTSKRSKCIQALRNKTAMCMIATSLADEGLDIPTLDSVLMAGGGASATRVTQRIGRTLRKSNNTDHKKTRSVVVIYEHDSRHLEDHAMKVRRMLKREKEFVHVNSKGPEYIRDEIDHILSETTPPNIFDV
jgi:superfamily II DNA or RNA helicase